MWLCVLCVCCEWGKRWRVFCVFLFPLPDLPPPPSSAGTRESAFVYSINSAGVVHAVTRACSRGAITNCACDLTKKVSGAATWRCFHPARRDTTQKNAPQQKHSG